MLVEILATCVLNAAVPPDEVVLPPSSPVTVRTHADSPFTHGSVGIFAAKMQSQAQMPSAGGAPAQFANGSQGGTLALEIDGRHAGFDLALGANAASMTGGSSGAPPNASGDSSAGITAVLHNGSVLFASLGAEVDAHAAIAATPGNSASLNSATSWQSVTAGPELRARLFAGRYLFATARAYAGVAGLSGSWQYLDAAASTPDTTGTISHQLVFTGSLAASARPVEWFAFTGGIALRDARGTLDAGGQPVQERTLRPFAGIELLY